MWTIPISYKERRLILGNELAMAKPSKVLFALVSWMKDFAPANERPVGGGMNN
jgi:hypothetical protein